MKHVLFLSTLMMLSMIAAAFETFWAVLFYYMLAVLRPHALWEWSLSEYHIRWSLIAAAIVVISLALNSNKLILRGRFNAILLLTGAFTAMVFLSVMTTYHLPTSAHWGVEYWKILFMAAVASFVIHRVFHIRMLLLVVMLCLGYIAWEVNYLYLAEGRLDIFHVGFAAFDNNGAALMLAMGIPLAYAFAASAKHRWVALFCAGVAMLQLHGVLMSYSRGAMLSALGAVIWLLLHHRPRYQVGIIAASLTVAVMIMAGPEIRERFRSTAEYQNDETAQGRLAGWSAAWQIAWDSPLTGRGIRVSNRYTANYGADRFGRTVHNQYLQIAADTGIPAAMIYIAMIVLAVYRMGACRVKCLRELRQRGDRLSPDDEHQLHTSVHLAIGAQTSLIVFAIGGMFLSMEVFELPWLLLVIGGVMPYCYDHMIHQIRKRSEEALEADDAADQPRSLRPSHAPDPQPLPLSTT